MANLVRPGFRWVRSMYGGTNGNPPRVLGRVADDYDGDLGGANIHLMVGMPVKMENTGTFSISAAGETVFGVVEGINPHWDANIEAMKYSNYLPNQTSYDTNYDRESQLIIIPVPGQLFRVQCDDATSATTYAAYRTLIGNNGDHVLVAGTAPTPTVLLDISTVTSGTTGTAQWRVEDIPDQDLQDFSSIYVELLVSCNEMQRNSTTGV